LAIHHREIVEFLNSEELKMSVFNSLGEMFEESDFQCLIGRLFTEHLEEHRDIQVVREVMHAKLHIKPDMTIVSNFDGWHVEALFEMKYDFGRRGLHPIGAMMTDIEEKLGMINNTEILKVFLCATERVEDDPAIIGVNNHSQKHGVLCIFLHFNEYETLANQIRNYRIQIEGL